MKILWIDLNSSYAHSSLALPALHAQMMGDSSVEWDIVSATINENAGMIVDEIYRRKPDILAATAWLFNHEQLMHVASRAKALLPDANLVLGVSGVLRRQRGVSTQEFLCRLRVQGRG